MPSISMKKDYTTDESPEADGLIIQQQQHKFPDSFKSLKNLWESKSTYTINSDCDVHKHRRGVNGCHHSCGGDQRPAQRPSKVPDQCQGTRHQETNLSRSTFLQRGHSLDNGHHGTSADPKNLLHNHDKKSKSNRSSNFPKTNSNIITEGSTVPNDRRDKSDQVGFGQLPPCLVTKRPQAITMKRHNVTTSSTYDPFYPFAFSKNGSTEDNSSKGLSGLSGHTTKSSNANYTNGGNCTKPSLNYSQLSSKDVLQQFAHYLTPEEHKEILKYDSVWYLGKLLGKASDLKSKRSLAGTDINYPPKQIRNGANGGSTYYYADDRHKTSNGDRGDDKRQKFYYYEGASSKTKLSSAVEACGPNYTDKDGLYKITIGDHIAYRYEITDVLGQGSFSQVVKAYDHRDNKYIALKIIRNKKRFHQQALTEIKLLKNLQNSVYSGCSDLTVEMMDHFYFRQHLCIVFELLGPSLYDTLKKSNFRGFPLDLVKDITGSLLKCLSSLRKHRIIHCDFKPENILVKPKTKFDIKLIDFGSSCYENEQLYTYIQSRFYRAPEVILGASQYTPAIDVWSLGCVAAELYTGYPLFPGEDEKDQLACFIQVLGLPPKEMSYTCERWKEFFDTKGNLRSNYKGATRIPNSQNLSSALKCSDYLFIDFLYKCFRWNPNERLTPKEALSHPWISSSPIKNPIDQQLIFKNNNPFATCTKSYHGCNLDGSSSSGNKNRRSTYLATAATTNGSSNSTSDTSLPGDAASSFSSNDSARINYPSLFSNSEKKGAAAYTRYKPKSVNKVVNGSYPSTLTTSARYGDMLKQSSMVGSLSCKLQHLEINGTKQNGPYGIDKKYYSNPYAFQALEK